MSKKKKKSANRAPSIPLRDMLKAIDTNNLGFLDSQPPELQKSFSPWMAMRYASSSSRNASHYLLMVNGIVNVDFNTLRGHPGLQWRLLAVCGTGVTENHPWIPPGRSARKDRVVEFLRGCYPHAKTCDLEVMRDLLTPDDLRELAVGQGMDDKSIKELLK